MSTTYPTITRQFDRFVGYASEFEFYRPLPDAALEPPGSFEAWSEAQDERTAGRL